MEITDFMVLASLGIITLSAVWLRRSRGAPYGRADILPIVVGASCFVAGGAVYLISSSVVVFGTLAILFAYLAFDILELGQLGVQLFLSVLSLACLPLLELFPHSVHAKGTFLSLLPLTAVGRERAPPRDARRGAADPAAEPRTSTRGLRRAPEA